MDKRQELIETARAVAREMGSDTLALRTFMAQTGLRDTAVYRHYRSWADLCRDAGLTPAHQCGALTDDELFSATRDALVACGGVTDFAHFMRHFRYSGSMVHRRGMTWRGMLFDFRQWAAAKAPDFPHMDQLPDAPPRPSPRRRKEAAPAGPLTLSLSKGAGSRTTAARPWTPGPRPGAGAASAKRGGRLMGEALNYRALQHAPVNEHGVVLLFGMAADELGFLIETVAPGFPDCEAKRLAPGGQWERVRIEFEFRSRNFVTHGHDPAGCDMIVCWTHDWPDCPLEVLELRSALADAPPSATGTTTEGTEDTEESKEHEE